MPESAMERGSFVSRPRPVSVAGRLAAVARAKMPVRLEAVENTPVDSRTAGAGSSPPNSACERPPAAECGAAGCFYCRGAVHAGAALAGSRVRMNRRRSWLFLGFCGAEAAWIQFDSGRQSPVSSRRFFATRHVFTPWVPPLICANRQTDLELPPAALGRAGRAHLIGAGGSGMQSLAAVLSADGWQLTGSDQAWAQAPVRAGNRGTFNTDVDLVIHSDAVPVDDGQRRRAGRLGIPTISYPAALGRLMASRRGLAVAGTHGKSTTSAMLLGHLARGRRRSELCFRRPASRRRSRRPSRGRGVAGRRGLRISRKLSPSASRAGGAAGDRSRSF